MEKLCGWCAECERFITLTKAGKLRHHGGPVGTGRFSNYRSYRCKGAGQDPGRAPNELDTPPGMEHLAKEMVQVFHLPTSSIHVTGFADLGPQELG